MHGFHQRFEKIFKSQLDEHGRIRRPLFTAVVTSVWAIPVVVIGLVLHLLKKHDLGLFETADLWIFVGFVSGIILFICFFMSYLGSVMNYQLTGVLWTILMIAGVAIAVYRFGF
jgi:predicted neutral ceramidase superfamily lipid hydrolase